MHSKSGATHVVCAILIRDDRYLVFRRAYGEHLAGHWEFPGGKVLPGESPQEALSREIQEELGISITIGPSMGESHFTLPGNQEALLEGFLCLLEAEPQELRVHDAMSWCSAKELTNLGMSPADIPLATMLAGLGWENRLRRAVSIRIAQDSLGALEQLEFLALERPSHAMCHYQIARTLDELDRSGPAIEHYQKAFELGLHGELRRQVMVGLANHHREMKDYQKSLELLTQAKELYPSAREILVFESLTLLESGENKKAYSKLLSLLANTTNDPDLVGYREAFDFYAENLLG